MVEVGDRVLVESEKVGSVTRSGVVTAVRGPADHRALGLRLGVGLCPKRRVPPGYRPRAARWGGRQALVSPGLDGEAREQRPGVAADAGARC